MNVLKNIIFGVLAVAAVAIVITLLVLWNERPKDITENTHMKQEEVEANIKKQKELGREKINPFGLDETQKEISETKIRELIHNMTHQKIKANEKWGFEKMTQEKIEWLLEAVKKQEYLERDQLYIEILEKWEKGNFEEVDEDHNAIWKLQGGSVGKARGILSDKQEKRFLEKQDH